MKKKQILAIALTAIMSGTMLAGCGASNDSGSAAPAAGADEASTEAAAATSDALAALPADLTGEIKATPDMYPNTDLSEPYEVNMYLIGDTPSDWDTVLEKANEYLKPFNTTLKVTFMSWSDYQTMYSLVLAGGEQVDCIFTAPWCYMYTEAQKGSFKDLNEDFRNQYMPLTQKYQAPESFDETTIGGKVVAVSSNTNDPNGKMVAIRQDLADKYGISTLGSWDDYKNFCKTIAEKETPESGILAMPAQGNNQELWDVYRQQYDTFYALQSGNIIMMYSYEEGKIPTHDQIAFGWDTEIFHKFAAEMKEMADAGCWSRSALNETVTDDDAFGNLQGASVAWNTSVFTYMKQAEQTEGVNCAAYLLSPDHLVSVEAYSNNDMAITESSENPERTAMVLDLCKFDTYLNRLFMLGIEGTHYTIDDQGNYTELEGSAGYPAAGISLDWAIKNGNLVEAGQDPRKQQIIEDERKIAVNTPTITFVFDDTNVHSQMDAVNTVLDDYVAPLELGLVDDPEASIAEMMQKCNDAGLQDIITEFNTQYDAWAATR